jgi:hypothetical protein
MIDTPEARISRIVPTRVRLGQAAGDFVEEEDLGPGTERAGELEPLALEERDPAGGHIRLRHEARLLDHVEAGPVGARHRLARALGRGDEQVLEHGHAGERLRNLE